MNKRVAFIAISASLLVQSGLSAQQVTPSINVLPVHRSDPPDPRDMILGDLFGERQGEPALVISPLNRNHMMIFFNDYRGVHGDLLKPVGTISSLFDGGIFNGFGDLLARLVGRPREPMRPERLAQAPTPEPWVGCAVSYDGGLTWTGCFLPGAPFDDSPASMASIAKERGYEFATDPAAVVDPFGKVYVSWLAGKRGGESGLLVSVFQFLNNDEINHSIAYVDTSMLEIGMNAENGHFLDLPSIALILTDETDSAGVNARPIVTAATFTGKGGSSKFQAKMNFWESFDEGLTWEHSFIDKSFTESQGSSSAVHPTSKEVSVVIRSFNSPDTYYLRTRGSNGKWTNPLDLLSNDDLKTLATFDQPFVSTQDTPFADRIEHEEAFRTFAFPSLAITPDGNTMIVVWHERIDPSTGKPSVDPDAMPGIVWKYSKDGGITWSEREWLLKDEPANRTEPVGFGFFNPSYCTETAGLPVCPTGPQFQPRVVCGAGEPNTCLVTYSESWPYAGADPATGLSPNGWIGGFDRVVNHRGVAIQAPATRDPVVGQSFQITRYDSRAPAPGEVFDDSLDEVAQLCPPGSDPTTGAGCYPAFDYSGPPTTGGGTLSFLHDYNGSAVIEQYVRDEDGPRLAVTDQDVPGGARYYVAYAGNRNAMWTGPAPAADADPAVWQDYLDTWQGPYSPTGLLPDGTCIAPQRKDQNVFAGAVSQGLMVTASTNQKPFDPSFAPIEFPTTVWNNTESDRTFFLTAENGSLSKTDPSHFEGVLTIFTHASSSLNVYVFNPGPTTLTVRECKFVGPDNCDVTAVAEPLVASISFNHAAALPPAGAPSPTYSPVSIALSPSPKSPSPKSPSPKSPSPKSPVPEDVTVYDTIEYSWEVSATTQDDIGTFLALAGVDEALKQDYIFSLTITKPSTLYTTTGPDGCVPANEQIGTLVGYIADPSNPLPDLSPENVIPQSPSPKSPTPTDILVQNSTFTLGASSGTGSGGAQAVMAFHQGCDLATGAGLLGECTMAASRAYDVAIATLVANQITPPGDPDLVPYNPNGEPDLGPPTPPPAFTVFEYWCTGSPGEICPSAQDGPDLAVPDPPADPATLVSPNDVLAGQTVSFPVGGVQIDNIGNQTALEHRYGIYLSTAATIEDLQRNPDGTIKEDPTGANGPVTLLLEEADLEQVPEGGAETIAEEAHTIPIDVRRPNADGTGTYYMYAFVDSKRIVNELRENNNIVAGGPITVRAPGYTGIIGLFSPCGKGGDPLACSGKTGTSNPIAFQLTFDGVTAADSSATKPRFRVYAPNPSTPDVCVTNLPPDGSGDLFLADEDDIGPGQSLWQYFAVEGTRPAFAWQYNFQGKDPVTGDNLPAGCYTFVVESPVTGQFLGTESLLGPITELSITLRP